MNANCNQRQGCDSVQHALAPGLVIAPRSLQRMRLLATLSAGGLALQAVEQQHSRGAMQVGMTGSEHTFGLIDLCT